MRTIVYLPVKLIKTAENEDWLRTLSYFVRMKALYVNNTHYCYSLRSLAERLKCSPSALSYHIKILTEKNLIRFHKGNLTFLGLRKLQSKYKYYSVGVPVDPKNQHDILRGQIIRFNLAAQQYKIRKSEIQFKDTNIPLVFREKTHSRYVGLSAAGLGDLFVLSKTSGGRLRKKLVNLGMFGSKRRYSTLYKNATLSQFKYLKGHHDIPPYARYIDGTIVIERRSEMWILKGNKGLKSFPKNKRA